MSAEPKPAPLTTDELWDLLEAAWGVIANAGGWPNTAEPSPGWLDAAIRWRERYHAGLDSYLAERKGTQL